MSSAAACQNLAHDHLLGRRVKWRRFSGEGWQKGVIRAVYQTYGELEVPNPEGDVAWALAVALELENGQFVSALIDECRAVDRGQQK